LELSHKTTQIFSVRSNPDPLMFKKIAVRSSPDLAKIGVSPDPCSSLAKNQRLSLVTRPQRWSRSRSGLVPEFGF